MTGYTERPDTPLDALIAEQTMTPAPRCPWCNARLKPGTRCNKRMCQLEEMGDSPSDYPRGRFY